MDNLARPRVSNASSRLLSMPPEVLQLVAGYIPPDDQQEFALASIDAANAVFSSLRSEGKSGVQTSVASAVRSIKHLRSALKGGVPRDALLGEVVKKGDQKMLDIVLTAGVNPATEHLELALDAGDSDMYERLLCEGAQPNHVCVREVCTSVPVSTTAFAITIDRYFTLTTSQDGVWPWARINIEDMVCTLIQVGCLEEAKLLLEQRDDGKKFARKLLRLDHKFGEPRVLRLAVANDNRKFVGHILSRADIQENWQFHGLLQGAILNQKAQSFLGILDQMLTPENAVDTVRYAIRFSLAFDNSDTMTALLSGVDFSDLGEPVAREVGELIGAPHYEAIVKEAVRGGGFKVLHGIAVLPGAELDASAIEALLRKEKPYPYNKWEFEETVLSLLQAGWPVNCLCFTAACRDVSSMHEEALRIPSAIYENLHFTDDEMQAAIDHDVLGSRKTDYLFTWAMSAILPQELRARFSFRSTFDERFALAMKGKEGNSFSSSDEEEDEESKYARRAEKRHAREEAAETALDRRIGKTISSMEKAEVKHMSRMGRAIDKDDRAMAKAREKLAVSEARLEAREEELRAMVREGEMSEEKAATAHAREFERSEKRERHIEANVVENAVQDLERRDRADQAYRAKEAKNAAGKERAEETYLAKRKREDGREALRKEHAEDAYFKRFSRAMASTDKAENTYMSRIGRATDKDDRAMAEARKRLASSEARLESLEEELRTMVVLGEMSEDAAATAHAREVERSEKRERRIEDMVAEHALQDHERRQGAEKKFRATEAKNAARTKRAEEAYTMRTEFGGKEGASGGRSDEEWEEWEEGHWICPDCTLVNSNVFRRCLACQGFRRAETDKEREEDARALVVKVTTERDGVATQALAYPLLDKALRGLVFAPLGVPQCDVLVRIVHVRSKLVEGNRSSVSAIARDTGEMKQQVREAAVRLRDEAETENSGSARPVLVIVDHSHHLNDLKESVKVPLWCTVSLRVDHSPLADSYDVTGSRFADLHALQDLVAIQRQTPEGVKLMETWDKMLQARASSKRSPEYSGKESEASATPAPSTTTGDGAVVPFVAVEKSTPSGKVLSVAVSTEKGPITDITVGSALCYPVLANALGGLEFRDFLNPSAKGDPDILLRIIHVHAPENVEENRSYVQAAAVRLDKDAVSFVYRGENAYNVYRLKPRTVLLVATHGDSEEKDWAKWVTAPVWRVITLHVRPVPPAFKMLPYDVSRTPAASLEEAQGIAEIQKQTPTGLVLRAKWDQEYKVKFPPPPEPPRIMPTFNPMGNRGRGAGRGARE